MPLFCLFLFFFFLSRFLIDLCGQRRNKQSSVVGGVPLRCWGTRRSWPNIRGKSPAARLVQPPTCRARRRPATACRSLTLTLGLSDWWVMLNFMLLFVVELFVRKIIVTWELLLPYYRFVCRSTLFNFVNPSSGAMLFSCVVLCYYCYCHASGRATQARDSLFKKNKKKRTSPLDSCPMSNEQL